MYNSKPEVKPCYYNAASLERTNKSMQAVKKSGKGKRELNQRKEIKNERQRKTFNEKQYFISF
jgi:hypothetical protein